MGMTPHDRRLQEAAELIAGLEAIIQACEPSAVLAALRGAHTALLEAEQAGALRARARVWLTRNAGGGASQMEHDGTRMPGHHE